jgi:hypothetical protein
MRILLIAIALACLILSASGCARSPGGVAASNIPLAPIRNRCAMTSGSDSGPTSYRHHSNRPQSTVAPKTPTTGARAPLAADKHQRTLDRIPKNEPTSQAA